MSLWWMWGGLTGTAPTPTPTAILNAPSLWSGGIAWGDETTEFDDGTNGYWGATTPASGRTGEPVLSVAIGGYLVREQLQRASFGLGRSDWLSTLAASSASFAFVDEPIATLNDTVVVGLMSDSTEYHSDARWVGRASDLATSRGLDGFTFSTVAATDVIGVLGQARAPESIAAGYTLKTLIERLAADAGIALQVDTDPLVTLPTLKAATGISGTVLDLINRAERSSNALLFLRGSGRLYAAMRESTGASSVRVVTLDGPNSPAGWDESTSLRGVVTRWVLGSDTWSTDTPTTTLEDYGEQTYSATDLLIDDPVPYANLISSDVLSHPRAILTNAPFPISNESGLEQDVLYLDPLDRVVADGVTWQVMSVQHEVSPADGWRVSITGDATQEALVGAPDPGPVEPPALNTVTLTYVSTKAATAERTSGGTETGTSLGDLLAGKFSNGSRYRSTIEWPIAWPDNLIRVVSAEMRLKTSQPTTNGRIIVRRCVDPWSEGTMDWPGPTTAGTGERRANIPKAAGKYVKVSVTQIATDWHDKGNDGLRISSVDDDSVDRRAAFYSDDSSNVEDRPTLTITCEVVS